MTTTDLKQKARELAEWFEGISGRTNGWHWNQAELLRDLVKEIERLEKPLPTIDIETEAENADKFRAHIEAVAVFLNELYTIMVDPCADGTISVSEIKIALINAALRDRDIAERGALHASAPEGHKCADCTMDKEACPICYTTWWHKRHPNTLVAEQDAAKAQVKMLVEALERLLNHYCKSTLDGAIDAVDNAREVCADSYALAKIKEEG